jgi:hypothetical protein
VDIYELSEVLALYLKDGVIIGEHRTKGRFEIDTPEAGYTTTKELFVMLKKAWNVEKLRKGEPVFTSVAALDSAEEALDRLL